jgi:hypothetical protein
MIHYHDNCAFCGQENDIADPKCLDCGRINVNPLNVRRAIIDETGLDARFNNAFTHAKTYDFEIEFNEFTSYTKQNGKAVINTNIDFLWQWLLENRTEYLSYRRQIINNFRAKAAFENDNKRATVDSVLYGSENDFIYSALSTDETGVVSYGETLIILKNTSIEFRTSAFEENSYYFVNKLTDKGWKFGERIPSGYFSIWNQKHKLAGAKYFNLINKGDSIEQFNRIILTSTGDRQNDHFIELHIDGKITAANVEKIVIPQKTVSKFTRFQILRFESLKKRYLIQSS